MKPEQDDIGSWVAQCRFRDEWLVYLATGDRDSGLRALAHLRDAGVISSDRYKDLRIELNERPPLPRNKKKPSKAYRDQRIIDIISFLLDWSHTERDRLLDSGFKQDDLPPLATVDGVINKVILRDFPGSSAGAIRRMWFNHKDALRRRRASVDPVLGLPARVISFGQKKQTVRES